MVKKQPIDLERLLTIRDVAALENTCDRTIRRRIASGELRAIRYGRQLRIRPQDLRTYRLQRLMN
jgi:excisionase family DNA binding protein